jgi:hypothetical protein
VEKVSNYSGIVARRRSVSLKRYYYILEEIYKNKKTLARTNLLILPIKELSNKSEKVKYKKFIILKSPNISKLDNLNLPFKRVFRFSEIVDLGHYFVFGFESLYFSKDNKPLENKGITISGLSLMRYHLSEYAYNFWEHNKVWQVSNQVQVDRLRLIFKLIK